MFGLGRVTYFEALFSLICPARMSVFDVVWTVRPTFALNREFNATTAKKRFK